MIKIVKRSVNNALFIYALCSPFLLIGLIRSMEVGESPLRTDLAMYLLLVCISISILFGTLQEFQEGYLEPQVIDPFCSLTDLRVMNWFEQRAKLTRFLAHHQGLVIFSSMVVFFLGFVYAHLFISYSPVIHTVIAIFLSVFLPLIIFYLSNMACNVYDQSLHVIPTEALLPE